MGTNRQEAMDYTKWVRPETVRGKFLRDENNKLYLITSHAINNDILLLFNEELQEIEMDKREVWKNLDIGKWKLQ